MNVTSATIEVNAAIDFPTLLREFNAKHIKNNSLTEEIISSYNELCKEEYISIVIPVTIRFNGGSYSVATKDNTFIANVNSCLNDMIHGFKYALERMDINDAERIKINRQLEISNKIKFKLNELFPNLYLRSENV